MGSRVCGEQMAETDDHAALAKADFQVFMREATRDLTDLNEAVNAKFGIMAWERFDYDLTTRELVFTHKGKPRVRAEIQLVGATGKDFVWAWANSWYPAPMLEDILKVRAWGEAHGIEPLIAPRLLTENITDLGWGMAAIAARLTGARGVYRPVDGQHSLFFLYRDIEFVT